LCYLKGIPPQKSNPPLTPPRRGIKTAKNKFYLKTEFYYDYNFGVISKAFPPQKSNPPLTPPRRGIKTAINRILLKSELYYDYNFCVISKALPSKEGLRVGNYEINIFKKAYRNPITSVLYHYLI
jgi:hypothetical protein